MGVTLSATVSDTIQSPAGDGSPRGGPHPWVPQWPRVQITEKFDHVSDRPTMLSELVDSVMVVAHGVEAPKQSEWNAMRELSMNGSRVRGIIVTGHPKCPGPNVFQRCQGGVDWARHKNAKMAVLTDSPIQRGIVNAFRWYLGDRVRAFSPAQWRDALGHVGVDVETQARILDWWHDAIRVLGEPREYAEVGIDPRRWKTQLLDADAHRTVSDRVAVHQVPAVRSPKHMATSVLGRDDLVLMVHDTDSPAQSEWEEHLRYMASLYERRPYRGVYGLIYSLGGGPNAHQRQELIDLVPPEQRGKLAVMTRSSFVQEAPLSFSWSRHSAVRVFGLTDYEAALRWLGIKSISSVTVQSEIGRLLKEVTVGPYELR